MTISDAGGLRDIGSRLAGLEGVSSTAEESLASHTTLRIGGPAEHFVRIQTESALVEVLAIAREFDSPFHLLGLGSNVLLPDEGLTGIVALLEGEFLETTYRDCMVEAGAGLPLAKLARATVDEGLRGLEALAGFPSTVGGAVVMNAGCYGVEVKDVLESAVVVWPDGRRQRLRPEDLEPAYRSTNLQGSGAVVTRATFRLQAEDPAAATRVLEDLNRRRRKSMPSGRPNAGSVFKNPPGDFAGRLIEACGLKGRQSGSAEISLQHANVIVNNGGASATDVLELMVAMHRAVSSSFKVALEPELVLVGSLRQRWQEEARR